MGVVLPQQTRHHYAQQQSVQYGNGRMSDEYVPPPQRGYSGYQVFFNLLTFFELNIYVGSPWTTSSSSTSISSRVTTSSRCSWRRIL